MSYLAYSAGVMRRFLQAILLLVLLTDSHLGAQRPSESDNFTVTVRRVGCFGVCPEYEVKIFGDGRVRYKGHLYVKVKGVHETKISEADVQKVRRKLEDVHFFDWVETDKVCVDLPEVHITAIAGKQRKHVVEGCDSNGRIPVLAD